MDYHGFPWKKDGFPLDKWDGWNRHASEKCRGDRDIARVAIKHPAPMCPQMLTVEALEKYQLYMVSVF
jgi:hypothetical protein